MFKRYPHLLALFVVMLIAFVISQVIGLLHMINQAMVKRDLENRKANFAARHR